MAEWLLALSSALWFGILTSISPCPLATNVAAVSFLGKQVGTPKQSVGLGLAYSLGRMSSYVLLAALLLYSALSAPALSHFLQSQMNKVLGPILVLVGLVLLGVVNIPLPSLGFSEQIKQRLATSGHLGAFGLGSLFAMSFCPTSAALFFASLLPLAVAQHSAVALPAIYGLGTALPVFATALLLNLGTLQLSKVFSQLASIELWVRRLSAVIFLAAGSYYCLSYLLPVLS